MRNIKTRFYILLSTFACALVIAGLYFISKYGVVSAQAIPPMAHITGTVTGTIYVGSYPPDPGTLVTLPGMKVLVNGTSLSALTNNQGQYTITGVPIGQYYIVTAYGTDPTYPQGSGVQVRPGESAMGVYIPSPGATVPVDLTIDYGASLGAP